MSSEVYYRSWMDKPHLDPNTNLLTEEYVQGIGEFMRLVQQQPDAKSGFSRNYKVWYLHGETGYEYGSTSEPQPDLNPDPDIRRILQFLEGYPRPPDPDKDSKIMDQGSGSRYLKIARISDSSQA
ncbi:hypothetical protein F2Q70_00026759 [Brassica cretica]|uniref:Uncharacterized protein n=1 Tax=Brassica cretica TaxID=69181 RepID=A0A8S9L8N5_BRACR|nr:hypothetical protein F2Q70_00026759 [Brassica cretica]